MEEDRRKQIILDLIKNFENKKILVIGDSILDEHVHTTAKGLSLETPTLFAIEDKTEYSWGGASNLVKNLLELEAKITFITALGEDKDAEHFENFKHENFNLIPIKEPNRKTIVKKRFWVEKAGVKSKHFELHKIDENEINSNSVAKIIEFVRQTINNYDTIILSDYRYGLLPKQLIDSLKQIAKENNKFVIAASQLFMSKANHKDYSGADIICMNLKEAREIYPEFSLENPEKLAEILNSGICITLGNQGSLLYLNQNKFHKQAIQIPEKDSCGAGDSFLAAFSLTDPLNNPNEALYLGNIWAGLSIKEIGTTTPKKQELINYISNYRSN